MIRKIKDPESSRIYQQEAIDLAFSFCPMIYPCAKCGHPVVTGYCCSSCGTSEPEGEYEVYETRNEVFETRNGGLL